MYMNTLSKCSQSPFFSRTYLCFIAAIPYCLKKNAWPFLAAKVEKAFLHFLPRRESALLSKSTRIFENARISARAAIHAAVEKLLKAEFELAFCLKREAALTLAGGKFLDWKLLRMFNARLRSCLCVLSPEVLAFVARKPKQKRNGTLQH